MPKKEQEIIIQAKFIAWEDNTSLRLIDINANPFVEELIQISNEKLTKEVDSMTIPYLYLKEYWCDKSSTNETTGGNYFKDNLPMPRGDVQQRLMKKHQILKSLWYLGANRCEEMIKKKHPDRFSKIYNRLFSVDYISDPENKCILELPFTFYDWRRIETIE